MAEMKKMKAIIKEAQRKKHREMEETDANSSKKAKYEASDWSSFFKLEFSIHLTFKNSHFVH